MGRGYFNGYLWSDGFVILSSFSLGFLVGFVVGVVCFLLYVYKHFQLFPKDEFRGD